MHSVLTKNQSSQKCLVHKEKAVANGGRRAAGQRLVTLVGDAGSAAVPLAAAAAEAANQDGGHRRTEPPGPSERRNIIVIFRKGPVGGPLGPGVVVVAPAASCHEPHLSSGGTRYQHGGRL